MTAEEEAAALARRLGDLDAEIDRVRRRIYMVQTGLCAAEDPDAAVAGLEARFGDLSTEFVETYRRWQSLERQLKME